MYRSYLKRLFDLLIAISAFIAFLPVFMLITVALVFLNDGKPFFTQLRPGLGEKFFKLYKFKTMNDKTDQDGRLLSDGQRLTGIGKVIRKTSLDELPQLINVIKGDMSLIGPRPLLTKYLPYYSSTERLRHQLRPGITGWAQVNGRNVSSWNDRLASDVFYYNNISFKLDAIIFYETIKNVLSAKDIIIDPDSVSDSLDVERSKGSESPIHS
ncbi:MAG: sugar transferase [Pyrinomonadaceae bacterium]|nr:sugar transferase [Sphingobacteriaceae bacterium]